jgi:adenine phosphoribosyltransferase
MSLRSLKVSTSFNLDEAIRKIPDFPKKGILFYDITSVLTNPAAFQYCIGRALELFKNSNIHAVAAIESRGFVFAAPIALQRGLPLILIRKKGKLPGETYKKSFSLEYGEDTIEVHKSDIKPGMNILLIDDLIATGGTLKAAAELLHQGGATVEAIFAVIGLPFLHYEDVLNGHRIETLINYSSE